VSPFYNTAVDERSARQAVHFNSVQALEVKKRLGIEQDIAR
jgi:hypothetical protein